MTNLQGISGFKIRGYIAGKEYMRSGSNNNLQSWTKVLETVLQYAYFSVISRFPLKTVHHFRNFLALFPPPTLYKVETRKKFWIHASNIVCGVREGLDLCELENAPETQKCPRTFVHDCRLYRIIVLHENEKLTRTGSEQLLRENNPL